LVSEVEAQELGQGVTLPAQDLSGRSRLLTNLLVSWGSHVVFVICGFVLPLFIDRQIGQAALGVWDFGWSLVGYFGLAQLGIGSSINRYVAKYRVEDNLAGLNRTYSSVTCIQGAIGVVIISLAFLTARWLLWFWGERLAGHAWEARSVVLLLGISLALQVAFGTFGGVITGCHRWDLHNLINAGSYALTVIGMILAVASGGGLVALACVNLVGTIIAELTRAAVAYRVCPTLRFQWRSVSLMESRQLINFGGKTFLATLSQVILYQTNSMLVVGYLGASVLALYSRPLALVRHAGTLVGKFSFLLIPTSSSIHARGDVADLRRLLIESSRWSAYMALPQVLTLAVLGGPILEIWMGPRYSLGPVLTILALGSLMAIVNETVYSILAGLDAHGPPAVVALAGALASVGLGAAALGPLSWGLPGAAVALTLPTTITYGIYIPAYACRRLGLPFVQYLTTVWSRPLVHVIPFLACLIGARFLATHSLVWGLVGAALVGGCTLLITYWFGVVPISLKVKIRKNVSARWDRLTMALRPSRVFR
jgi:O-antigen/teichoic acid export membrane protein